MSEHQNSYGSVSPPFWEDSEVWIIGNGPSRKSVDPAFYRGKRVIAINDALYRMKGIRANISFFSLDNNWIRGNRAVLESFSGDRYIALPLETWPECGGIKGATYLQWGFSKGLSDDPAVINPGGHSGHGALNLAYLKRAKKIFIVGIDLDPGVNIRHFYWAREFDHAVPQLEAAGVTVVNLSPKSFVGAFLKKDPAELAKGVAR